MDKKAKKRIEVLQPKLQKLRMQLAGAKKQMDDADEVRKLEAEIASIERELKDLKGAP
jgi:capsule polysaccharide export protein KpsE/RkpR